MQSTPRRSARLATRTNNSPAPRSDYDEFSDESSFSTCVPSADEGSVYSLSEEEESSDDEPVSSRKTPAPSSRASKPQPPKSSSKSPGKQQQQPHSHHDAKENAPNSSNNRQASPKASSGHPQPSPQLKTPAAKSQRPASPAPTKAKPAGPTEEQVEAVEKVLRASKSGSFYTVLDVPRTATEREITRQYRKKALKLHPDKNPAGAASEAFRAVSEAYETLNSPTKRMIYDLSNVDIGSEASSVPRSAASQRTYEEQVPGSSIYNTILVGTRVTLCNINTSYNGLTGTVYSIRMDNPCYGSTLIVEPSWLTQNMKVRVRSNQYGAAWYQAIVTVVSYSAGADQYSVRHPQLSGIFFLSSYGFIIPDGSIVRIEGLWNRPEYNGRYGKVMGWTCRIDPLTTYDTSYYEVQLSANTIVRAKMANVRL
ncbi:hypothetical protein ACHAXT_004696 [Thalassiosira profunda]